MQITHELDDNLIEWIVELTREFAQESNIFREMEFCKDRFREYIKNITNQGALCVTVYDQERVLGYTLFSFDQDYTDKVNCDIITHYVHPLARKTKAARMLAERTVEIIDEIGGGYAHLYICAKFDNAEYINKLTANLYKKFGFEEIGLILGRKGKSWAGA